MKFIAEKSNMTQIWQEEKVTPVTILLYTSEGELPFKEGDLVKVSGHAKGRGFQGVVKRHGFHGGPKTHGQKNRLRAPGSIGATAPQRVIPGHRMAGHMGTNRVSVKNIRIAQIIEAEKKILVNGAVPGMRGSTVELALAPKNK
jgi:large subunit ribosomal protein L3